MLLKVDEPVLYAEINKLKNNRLATSTPSPKPFEQNQGQASAQTALSASQQVANPYDVEEREVLRFLVKYGEAIIETKESGEA